VEVLASRLLLRPRDLARSRRFYRDILGLAVYREFGSPSDPSVVFFLGGGFLELSGTPEPTPSVSAAIWLQVRALAAEHHRLADLGVPITRAPQREPWGLLEMWLTDPDGIPIVLVEVPDDHPLRRDQRAGLQSPPNPPR
jgi:catechol 2,3-dioxygenase-like lactoylglutathione lyase family enzyme